MSASGLLPKFTNLANPWQRFRSQTGMSQAALARALGVRQSTVCKWEKTPRAKWQRWPSRKYALALIDLAEHKKIRMALYEIYPPEKKRKPYVYKNG